MGKLALLALFAALNLGAQYVPPGGSGGGSTSPGSPDHSVQTNQGGVFTGDSSFLWDATAKKLRINSGVGGFVIELGADGYVNGGSYNGDPTDNTAAAIGVNVNTGGVSFQGYSDGTGTDGSSVNFQAYLSGSPASPAVNKPLIYFTTFTDDSQALKGSTLWGVDNDFTHDGNGQYALQLIEKHGTVTGGFPDSVGFFGINTTTPAAVLHALNPTTANDDDPKNYVVSLIEGRSDQIADLMQWKKTGGSALSRVTKDGALQLAMTASEPACASGVRGTFWYTASGAGVKDKVEVCAKDAGDAYAWRTIY